MHAPAGTIGTIGPNAIIRVAEALPAIAGEALTRRVFERASLARYLRTPPDAMVPEEEVRRLHAAMRAVLGAECAAAAARDAGRRTAAYLLAHRIPKPAQRLMRVLPAPLAAGVLLAAIRRNAWTFVGSGQFEARAARPCSITIRDNPLCRGVRTSQPACDFYTAVFEQLFVQLVHPATRVREVSCAARGDSACRFTISR